MTGTQAVQLVARREMMTRLRSRAFKITTAAMLLAVVGFSLVFTLVGADSGSQIGYTPTTAALAEPLRSLATATDQTVTLVPVDQADGEARLRSGDLDALVTGTPDAFVVEVQKNLSGNLQSIFTVLTRQQVLNRELARAGADPVAVNRAVNAATVTVHSLEPPREFQTQRFVLSIIVGILVYLALLIYGPAVAQGVVEEKSNRIVEILLTTIRPWQLMVGKVLGIGIVGLGQLVLVSVAGVIAGLSTGTIDFPSSIAATVAVWAVVWFLLGYLAYALIFAALGALVSRQEDVGAVTAPALMFIIAPYVLGISILPSDPDNRLLTVLSMIPVFSPTLMPMRVALGVVPGWQLAIAVALTVLLIVGLVWLAGRVYGNAVLRTGSRVKLGAALRGA